MSKETPISKRLRIKSGMISMGETIEWGSDSALMEDAADLIDHLFESLEIIAAWTKDPVIYGKDYGDIHRLSTEAIVQPGGEIK